MATLDLSKSTYSFSMGDPDAFGFSSAIVTQPNSWVFTTPDGNAIRLQGSGLTYDSQGRAVTGTITSVSIDLGNNDAASPDVRITGISAAASLFDNGPASFWRFLEGNDVILGPVLAQGASGGTFTLFGDGLSARSRGVGGRDVIQTGDGYVMAFGDVENVGSPVAGSSSVRYRGGSDEILGLETTSQTPQLMAGDAGYVHAGSRLTGGGDTMLIRSSYSGSSAVGDAYHAFGSGAKVYGGNDYITAGSNFQGTLVGDVHTQAPGSFVQGGADTINGSDLSEVIVGDVYRMTTSTLAGGADTINAGAGDDTIYGDSYFASADTTVTGGHDIIQGGAGDDRIYGDFGNGGLVTKGGNDRLDGGNGNDTVDGDSGDDVLNGGSGSDVVVGNQGDDWLAGGSEKDRLYAGAGNDMLDGGSGADDMRGDAGDDTYFVNSYSDTILEQAGAAYGIDTVWTTLASGVLGANVENLRSNGVGPFTGVGNAMDNIVAGGGEADNLYGADGNDTLVGHAGGDRLDGGAGIDTVSYAGNGVGINVRLVSGIGGYGGDATGDVYVGIENFIGTDFTDSLYGNELSNTLMGGAGNDYLQGSYGNDTVSGGAGQDDLVGGYNGDDAFLFNAPSEGRDRVLDFEVDGTDDTVLLEGDAFGRLATGVLSAGRFTADGSGTATATGHRFVYETDTGILRYDSNGFNAGGVTEIALIAGTPVLSADDLVIV